MDGLNGKDEKRDGEESEERQRGARRTEKISIKVLNE